VVCFVIMKANNWYICIRTAHFMISLNLLTFPSCDCVGVLILDTVLHLSVAIISGQRVHISLRGINADTRNMALADDEPDDGTM
jgi:hypothetical protein